MAAFTAMSPILTAAAFGSLTEHVLRLIKPTAHAGEMCYGRSAVAATAPGSLSHMAVRDPCHEIPTEACTCSACNYRLPAYLQAMLGSP